MHKDDTESFTLKRFSRTRDAKDERERLSEAHLPFLTLSVSTTAVNKPAFSIAHCSKGTE
jgi:hypothetical protein